MLIYKCQAHIFCNFVNIRNFVIAETFANLLIIADLEKSNAQQIKNRMFSLLLIFLFKMNKIHANHTNVYLKNNLNDFTVSQLMVRSYKFISHENSENANGTNDGRSCKLI